MREAVDNSESPRARDVDPHSRSNDNWAWGDGQSDALGEPAADSALTDSHDVAPPERTANAGDRYGDTLIADPVTGDSASAEAPGRGAGDATDDRTLEGRDRALAGYALDSVSQKQAVACGESASQYLEPEQWRAADFESRMTALRAAEEVLTTELSLQPAPAMVDLSLNDRTLGWSDGERVGIAISTLEADTPTDMLETLAHEYRHQWQQKVISGELTHPAGEAGRMSLLEGQATYQEYDFDAYVDNALELDAEAFAREFSGAYHEGANKKKESSWQAQM